MNGGPKTGSFSRFNNPIFRFDGAYDSIRPSNSGVRSSNFNASSTNIRQTPLSANRLHGTIGSESRFQPRQAETSFSLGGNRSSNFTARIQPQSSGLAQSTLNANRSSNLSGVRNLWSAQEAQISRNAASMLQNSTSTATRTAVQAGQAATGAVGSMAGPVGMAAAISQQIGSGINDAMTSKENAQSKADYASNMNAKGLDSGTHASLIHGAQQADIQSRNTAGMIGSLFGPIGALAGHALGSIKFDSSMLNTTGSLSGRINGSDTGVAAAHSSAVASGASELQNNV